MTPTACTGSRTANAWATLTLEPGVLQLVEEDGVGLAEDVEALGGHLAQAADGQSGAGERMAPDQGIGEPQLETQATDLVLEEVAQGLDQLEAQLRGEPADVVVDLDRGRGTVRLAAALDHVGIERALGEEACAGDRSGRVAEDVDERVADPPSLLLWVGHALESLQERLGRVDDPQLGVGARAERLGDRGPLAASQESRVDEDADNPRAQGPGQQRRTDRRIDATG